MKALSTYSIILFTLLILWGCDENENIYNGKSLLEFSDNNIVFEYYYNDTGIYTIHIPFQIIKGSDFSEDITIHYSITPTKSNTVITDLEKSYTSNGSLIDSLPISLNLDNLNDDETLDFTITFLSTSSISYAENYKQVHISIHRNKFIYKFTGLYSCYEPVNQVTYDVYFNFINDSCVSNTNFWDFPGYNETVKYYFNSETDSISISENNWKDAEGSSYNITAKGVFENNGFFSIDYSIKRDNALIEEGKQFYTKKE